MSGEGEHRGITWEVSIDTDIEDAPFLKIFFYEDDAPSHDIIHHGYCHTYEGADELAVVLIDEELGDE